MLGKLIKHEFKATYKIFGLLFGALLALTLLTKFCVYIPDDYKIFKILKIILTVLYVIIVVCMSLFSVVIVLMRFNNNMLKDQGYLSHTLPVKMWQQITAKVLTYMVWVILSVMGTVISLGIFFTGEGTGKVIRMFVNGLSDNKKLIPMLICFTVIMIMQIGVNILNFFAAMSLGQIFSKHRTAGAVLFYFILNYALSFISSLLMLVADPLMKKIETIDAKLQVASSFGDVMVAVQGPMYAYMGVLFVMEIFLAVVYFAITNYMLTRKLNLE